MKNALFRPVLDNRWSIDLSRPGARSITGTMTHARMPCTQIARSFSAPPNRNTRCSVALATLTSKKSAVLLRINNTLASRGGRCHTGSNTGISNFIVTATALERYVPFLHALFALDDIVVTVSTFLFPSSSSTYSQTATCWRLLTVKIIEARSFYSGENDLMWTLQWP